ncbi:MAG: PASTA domain-containing protein [Endomicrobium sp.]|nr:PASTA domain-containing protein [Endomicrobium sp.]
MLRKVFRVLILSIIIFAALYCSFNMVMSTLIHNKKEIIVPNVAGKNLYDAMEELSNSGFGIKKDGEEFNQNFPAGTILRQNPAAGMNVREGKLVKVVTSRGGETVNVPNLVGQTLRSADIALKYSSLVMGEVSKKYSITADRGIVISQDIAPTATADKDSAVNIIVSDGPPPKGIILMPDFLNKKLEDARIWVLQYNIALNITREDADGIETNTVIKQYPEPGADITNAKDINLHTAVNTINLK